MFPKASKKAAKWSFFAAFKQSDGAGVTLKILFKSICIWIYKFLISLFPAQLPVSHTTNLEASKRGEKLETLGT